MAVALVLIESVLILLAACVALFLSGRPLEAAGTGLLPVLGHAGALSLSFIMAFYFSSLYNLRVVRSFSGFLSRLPRPLGVVIVLLAVFHALFPKARTAEAALSSYLPMLLLIVGFILSVRAVFYALLRSRFFCKRALIVGTSPLAFRLMEEIEAQPHSGYAVVGMAGSMDSFEDLRQTIEKDRLDRIIVALAKLERRPARRLLEAQAHGIVIEEGVEVYERITGKLAIESLTPGHLLFSREFNRPIRRMDLRRVFNQALAAIGLILSAPLMVFIAVAVKLDSKGPVFFIQERAGREGRPFRLVKFRTMHPAREKRSEWVEDNGDRITRVGKWLRKFRLDELPQFMNILAGDMNLVGPRPHPVSNLDLFVLVSRNTPDCGELIPYYSVRSTVRPGITGWSQVRYGYANNLDEEIEKLRYDLYYIKHQSVWLDLRILFETARILLSGSRSHAHVVRGPSEESEAKTPIPSARSAGRAWAHAIPKEASLFGQESGTTRNR